MTDGKIELDIRGLLEGSAEELKRAALEGMKQELKQALDYNTRQELYNITGEFVKTQIGPELKALLADQKPAIVEELKTAVVQLSAELAKSLLGLATKNIEQSYHTREIAKQLFNY